MKRGSPEWNEAVNAYLARAIAAGRIPAKPPKALLGLIFGSLAFALMVRVGGW